MPWRTRKWQNKGITKRVGVSGVGVGQVEAGLVDGSGWKDCSLRLPTALFEKSVLTGLSQSQKAVFIEKSTCIALRTGTSSTPSSGLTNGVFSLSLVTPPPQPCVNTDLPKTTPLVTCLAFFLFHRQAIPNRMHLRDVFKLNTLNTFDRSFFPDIEHDLPIECTFDLFSNRTDRTDLTAFFLSLSTQP